MERQNTDKYELNKLIAQTKFAAIAPVVSCTFTDESITAYFKRIAEHPLKWPDGTEKKFSAATMHWWLHIYRKFGFEGLIPRGRSDNGNSRKLNDTQKEHIVQLLNEYPKITGVMIYEKMIKDGLINQKDISLDTLQRYIRTNGLRDGKGETILKERRAWEYARSCEGYEADTCHTFYIYDKNGEYRKTYLIAIIDNHSRMIVGAEFFFNDTAVNFQKVWKSAVIRYGRSKVMILDNGSSYKNKSTNEIEAKLGTKLIYNPPNSPTGKAVIERFFHTMKMRFLDVNHGNDYHSLDELNSALNAWVSEYNRTRHSALKDDPNDNHSPLERYIYDMKDTSPCRLANKTEGEYKDWVEDVFLHETTRKVNGDSTVMINEILFDVPSIYIGERVLIRYEPRKYENVYLYDVAKKEKVVLKKTDKVENAHTRRTEIIY